MSRQTVPMTGDRRSPKLSSYASPMMVCHSPNSNVSSDLSGRRKAADSRYNKMEFTSENDLLSTSYLQLS